MQSGLLYAVVPAAVGFVVSITIASAAARKLMENGVDLTNSRGKLMVLRILPFTYVMFAGILTQVIASGDRGTFLAIGIGFAAIAIAQGVMIARLTPSIVSDAMTYGKSLVAVVMMEPSAIFIVVIGVLNMESGLGSAMAPVSAGAVLASLATLVLADTKRLDAGVRSEQAFIRLLPRLAFPQALGVVGVLLSIQRLGLTG